MMEIIHVHALARRWIQLLASEYQNCPADFDVQFERGLNFGPESTGGPLHIHWLEFVSNFKR